MPNYCYYSMCVKGSKKNVEEFIKVMQADYNYSEKHFTFDRHMFRVFSAYADEVERDKGNVYSTVINGDCAWSVSTCMFEGNYYNSLKERYPDEFRGTTLLRESKRLKLNIEVYSEESGCCFQEHYVIMDGDLIVDECVEWEEYSLDEYETKEEAERELEITITDEEWSDNEGYITRGGFDNWDFEI